MKKTILKAAGAAFLLVGTASFFIKDQNVILSLAAGCACGLGYLWLLCLDIGKLVSTKRIKPAVARSFLRYVTIFLAGAAAAKAGLSLPFFFSGFFMVVLILCLLNISKN